MSHEIPSAHERAKEIKPTSRGLKEYLELFHLDLEDLKGKTILDLGSGQSTFAQEVKEKGIDAKVYSLDVDFGEVESQEDIERIRGVAQHMPFEEKSFDLILASNSVPLWIFGLRKKELLSRVRDDIPKEDRAFFAKEMQGIFSETSRILKPGGRAFFAPNDVYYGSVEHPLAPVRGRAHGQFMTELEREILADDERSYDVYTEPAFGGDILHLVNERVRPEENHRMTAPPDTRFPFPQNH